MNAAVLLHLALGLIALLAPGSRAGDLAARLDELRAATLGEAPAPAGQVLSCEGRTRYAGLDGRFRFVFAPDGRFLAEIDNELGSTLAFDGTRLLGTDRLGVTRERILGEAEDAQLVNALIGGGWLREDPRLQIALGEGDDAERLQVRWADTSATAELELDGTQLLGFVRPTEAGPTSYRLSDWRVVGTQRVPHRIEQLQDAALENVFEVETARWIADDPALFRLEPGSVAAHAFDASIAPELEVRRVATGHQLVRARLDGEDAGWFIFDTGAGGLVVTPAVAEAHEMPTRGEVVALGASGTTTTTLRHGRSIGVGPLTLEAPVFVELDLAFLTPIFGVEVAGIVGYDVLAHAVIELRPATDHIAVHDPASYELGAGSWHELLLDANIPTVHGRFEDRHDALFHIDTGADDHVTFHAPIVERLRLLEGRELRGSRSQGVGGQAQMWNAPMSAFEVAGQRFEELPVRFSTAEVGAFAAEGTAGNIGQSLIGDAMLVFDYPHGRLAWIAAEDTPAR